MNLRLMVTAFIKRDNKILMIHRSENKEIAPGLWAGIGGHVESEEMKYPNEACFREIHEETGLSKSDIFNFRLKCIVFRNKDNVELRQQFVYFCETTNEINHTTDEGQLHWIDESKLLKLDMPKTCQHIIKAYLSGLLNSDDVFIGISSLHDGKDILEWVKIVDFDVA
jgi:8-oxo-dGTP diphosphatase